MAAMKLGQQDLDEIRALAKGWGKIVVRRAFGEQGPGLDVDLDMMEEIAVAAVQGLTEGTLEEATHRQSELFGDQEPCPACGTLANRKQEPRNVVVRGGSFEHDEPVYDCPKCRRSFFPSADGAQNR
jgi:hypothetical protein